MLAKNYSITAGLRHTAASGQVGTENYESNTFNSKSMLIIKLPIKIENKILEKYFLSL